MTSADVDDMRECHSLVTPAPVRPDELAGRTARTAGRWRALEGVRLWPCEVPDDAVADRTRREASRPVGDGVRVVLVHSAKQARLVLVARRSALSERALRLLASAVTGGEPLGPEPEPGSPPRTTSGGAPEWGLGDRTRAGRQHRLPVSVAGDEKTLLAAAAVTLSTYTESSTVHIGLNDAVHRVGVPDSRSGLADFDVTPGGDRADVGIIVSGGGEYLPRLAPPNALTLHGAFGGGRFTGWCHFDEGAVTPAVAEAFSRHVEHVADQLVSAQGEPGGHLSAEAETAVLALGRTPLTGPGLTGRIDQVVAAVARSAPDAVAVSDEKTELTYRQLDERATRVAAGLGVLGARRGDLVGVCLDRGTDLVVALLGVLKAGCAYVPLEPHNPPERLRFIAEDAGVRWVVGTPPPLPGITAVALRDVEAHGEGRDPEAAGSDEDTAYVIYTSGSTGRPKGVLVPHRNVVALMNATRGEFALGARDTWTMFHSSAFDFSVWEVWGCLLTGGSLVVVSYWAARDAEAFRALLARRKVTVLSQTPSAFTQLIRADQEADDGLAVRLVVLGGEPVDLRGTAPWFARYPHTRCRVVNMFGITETTVHVTAQTIGPAEVVTGSRSVGRALPGWSVSVRDQAGQVLPVGAPGEIWVGGAGVAEGYLGRPELTAERFVTDPVDGERRYRSGDRGRLRPDGRLDHLGRVDNQVKIRGYRIELDEIRSVLVNDVGVAAAVVTVGLGTPDDPASARIDAFVVLPGGRDVGEVWSAVRGLLPEYMVPSTITAIPALPLTPNGKADLAALPEPVLASQARGEDTACGDDLGGNVLALWSDVLNTEVKREDNFFELGGNSLLVERVLITMRSRRMPRVSVREFYLNSTAGQFIDLVTRLGAGG
ncbi:non-ribosomal peptide synthetase [Lentzea flaviverrucosa]|uniref:Amino acid adenylation domain-containing protein n=1 Tax=Lentzea flaviverrucosa TaxID=200379 RepID=A0A1H9SDN8_9PSEU|nr:non-ribosomal peptide synthetase [Lentzea flaviverrucosa]RDI25332.1 amino acid adenylation domain-containing protein [Lentzea flaviverrucosa]SER83140.1 amino acid adenylation domain-containing protein [Lentzea flaviverrucosa]